MKNLHCSLWFKLINHNRLYFLTVVGDCVNSATSKFKWKKSTAQLQRDYTSHLVHCSVFRLKIKCLILLLHFVRIVLYALVEHVTSVA